MDKSNKMFPPNFVIVDDWRFPNEAEFFGKNPLLDVAEIRVYGRGGLEGELGQDESEVALPESGEILEYYDYDINNENSMEELQSKAREVVESLRKNYIV
jgi:hypothetical protein